MTTQNSEVLFSLTPQWLENVMEIWLTSNCQAHDFIQEEYWKGHYQDTKEALPESDVTVYVDQGKVLGFVGISPGGKTPKEGYLAGIFVAPEAQGKGIGRQLLDSAKERYQRLTLHVYKKNQGAYRFYEREGFSVAQEVWDEENQEAEFEMTWTRP